jgi:pyruvate dehydrogenase complex dehydrogenase (E1) component
MDKKELIEIIEKAAREGLRNSNWLIEESLNFPRKLVSWSILKRLTSSS